MPKSQLGGILYIFHLGARSAKFFWEEIFMPKSQLGGILYIFPPGIKYIVISSNIIQYPKFMNSKYNNQVPRV